MIKNTEQPHTLTEQTGDANWETCHVTFDHGGKVPYLEGAVKQTKDWQKWGLLSFQASWTQFLWMSSVLEFKYLKTSKQHPFETSGYRTCLTHGVTGQSIGVIAPGPALVRVRWSGFSIHAAHYFTVIHNMAIFEVGLTFVSIYYSCSSLFWHSHFMSFQFVLGLWNVLFVLQANFVDWNPCGTADVCGSFLPSPHVKDQSPCWRGPDKKGETPAKIRLYSIASSAVGDDESSKTVSLLLGATCKSGHGLRKDSFRHGPMPAVPNAFFTSVLCQCFCSFRIDPFKAPLKELREATCQRVHVFSNKHGRCVKRVVELDGSYANREVGEDDRGAEMWEQVLRVTWYRNPPGNKEVIL